MGETADGDLHNKACVSTYTSQKFLPISRNHCISWISPREEPFLNLVQSCTKDLLMEQVNCKKRNLIPVKCKPPSYWVNYSQRSSDSGPLLVSLQPPENLLLSGDRLCCLDASRKRKRRQAKAFFFPEKREKNCRSIEKIPMGQQGVKECSSFLSF